MKTKSMKRPKLPLTTEEKALLRKVKLKISDISRVDAEDLAIIINASYERALTLRGLAQFQMIPSIGVRLSEDLVYKLELYHLNDMKKMDGATLLNQLEEKLGYWTDPCVEDQLRCVIHHANHPNSDKQWHDFTDERKAFRKEYGYPISRPRKAWHDKRDG
ncbi:helix-hairpin-helix domain-containing protein [Evansella cellulosilytica]|uniref:Pathogenicity locus n=1 Tax=Evansella cellulosilytica (strain ATCC 21833 / DSM 2522 / FERM P-1141 / JCM 9156 / N-4) TaxID=649639 RepID=E6TZ76_EVAC2|nr:helix-hairpin-helix domain-containing protein [Evansella cellulosilytica]ADU28938.1 hypothetical protein Bcell_0656 [Evansella cellulosilytica DSM 2522]